MKRISYLFIVLVLATLAGTAHAGECGGKVNLNTATIEELSMVPEISNETARNIIDYRASHGPFTSLKELRNVKGVYASSISELRCVFKLEGTTDFDVTCSRRNWCNKNNLE